MNTPAILASAVCFYFMLALARDNLQRLALRLAVAVQWMFPWVSRILRQRQLDVPWTLGPEVCSWS